MHLNIHYLPQFVAEEDLAGSTVVMVDLLRASTTICTALANGAMAVRPFVEVDATAQAAAEYEREKIVLGGERGGEPIEGFDLGNSPLEYTADVVFGQTILFTTTNGTRALGHAHLASRVLVGAAVNRQAVVERLRDEGEINILCAGTGGVVTREDILAAGAIAEPLLSKGDWSPNEWAEAAVREWQELVTTARALGRSESEQFAEELKTTPGGRNLLGIGRDEDLPVCAQLDVLDLVPELNRENGLIV
ncbi:2-phosphosulfolactate phosphatase [Adhaeretor mobilis]|uniref:Probable 2-phosphosulfolactate phosphatase n=1 Tax=Adhaeretor mobilis TaxID=1930276 RepID=A0A517N1Y7_9BACT|nr:2-phosphosulfolactate phosphatase [Adhaeretor mobilis]QDT01018.1 putative 2-phosphosulfolactate phosphatase [Adhaeretor mobilis]